MKITPINITDFSEIGTIVYYMERPFNATIRKSGLPLYSTSMVSEYTDFAKSGFSFDDENLEYKRELLPNLYNYKSTTNLLGSIDIDDLVNVAFPSISKEEETNQRKHYFGKLTNFSTQTSYLSHLPSGVWKVEVYNSKITSNCGIEGIFVEYDLMSQDEIRETPILSICFGPDYDVRIKDFTLEEIKDEKRGFKTYLSRYESLREIEYIGFDKVMTKEDYIESYQEEVMSE